MAENIYLGREPRRGRLVNKADEPRKRRSCWISGITAIEPTTQVRSLTAAEQQVVEIAEGGQLRCADHLDGRAHSCPRRSRGRASLRDHGGGSRRGVTAIPTSPTASRSVRPVRRDHGPEGRQGGQHAASVRARRCPELVRLMVGRPISAYFPDKLPGRAWSLTVCGEPILELHGRRKRPPGRDKPQHPARRDCRPGRAAGVRPHGCSEGIFGAETFTRGAMKVADAELLPKSPRQARAHGPDHRGPQGRGAEPEPVDPGQRAQCDPVGFPAPHRAAAQKSVRHALLSRSHPATSTRRCSTCRAATSRKWSSPNGWRSGPRLVLLDEPTRGIDVGAKVAIYELMRSSRRRARPS